MGNGIAVRCCVSVQSSRHTGANHHWVLGPYGGVRTSCFLTASRCQGSACAGTHPSQSAGDLEADDVLVSGLVVPKSRCGGQQGGERAGGSQEVG